MLKHLHTSAEFEGRPENELSLGAQLDFDKMLAACRRQLRVFLLFCAIGAGFGLGYAFTAVPQYTTNASVLIDNSKARALSDIYTGTAQPDASYIDSQVELLASEKIGSSVIDHLKLIDNRAFNSEVSSFLPNPIGAAKAFLSGFSSSDIADNNDAARRGAAIAKVRDGLRVHRVDRTYVLRISFTSTNPGLAALIANGFAEAYLRDQLEAKYEATRRASTWLHERVAELRQSSMDSDLAVQKFKVQHNLASADGRLVSDQQLSELNSQLILAKTQTAQAEARYNRIRSIVDNKQMDAAVPEAIASPVIGSLRERYMQASKRQSELSARLGADHVSVISFGNEMRQYERLIFEELGRIAEGYLSELRVAEAREKSMSDQVNDLMGVSGTNNEILVRLRDLERESDTYRTLYQSFLQRYQEAVQQQSFPINEARIISNAGVPKGPSAPQKKLSLALGLVLGGMVGASVGFLREQRDRTFRSGAQIRSDLGLEFLGMLNVVEQAQDQQASRKSRRTDDSKARIPTQAPPILRHVLDKPLSAFTETLRTAKVATDITLGTRTPKIIGVISVLPGEGKSTVSKNLASLLAHLGSPTLLIDADIRTPNLTRAIAPDAEKGLLEVILDNEAPSDLWFNEPDSRLKIMPCVKNRGTVSHTSEILSSPDMAAFLNDAGSQFEHIVLDLPPMGPVVDVRAFERRVDAFILVIEWGSTPRKLVRNTLLSHEHVYKKITGAILNKAAGSEVHLYDEYGSSSEYTNKYVNYYEDA